MKRLSAIIPGYNTPKAWWQRCVASVQAAIGPDDEIIVVDDGSKTPVEKNWFAGDVKVVRRQNGGLSAGRNTGFELAQGKYVAFIDSDDEVEPEAFNKSVAKLESDNADIAIFGVRTVWVEERLTKVDLPSSFPSGKLSPDQVNDLLHCRVFHYAWNKVYRAGFMREHQLVFDPDGMPCEDIIFNLQCVMAGARWCSVNHVGYVYYRTGMTLLSTYKPSNVIGLKHGSDAWVAYKKNDPAVQMRFGKYGELSEASALWAEWENLWKARSPFGWHQKCEWLKKHSAKMGCAHSTALMMLQKALFTFLRRNCYIRPIRRWNIKRQYPHAVDVKENTHHSSTSTLNFNSPSTSTLNFNSSL